MERIRQNYLGQILKYVMIVTACVAGAVCGFFAMRAVFSIDLSDVRITGNFFNTEARSMTSTTYRYADGFYSTLLEYDALADAYQEDMSFAMPGLANTNVLGENTDMMIPQGICRAGDYILISAYNADSDALSGIFKKEILNSVIYLMDAQGNFLTTLVLPDVNHVGGIAFDGKRVWVAKSTDESICAIDYDDILQAAQTDAQSYLLGDYAMELPCGRTASFIQIYDGKIWIGTYRGELYGSSEVGMYEMIRRNGELALEERDCFEVPANAQGISFYENEGQRYCVIATSHGRFRSSVYYLYSINRQNGHYEVDYKGECDMPPMAEEMYSDGQNTYLMYESAASKYSTNQYSHCIYPVDRVCSVSDEAFLAGMEVDLQKEVTEELQDMVVMAEE